MSDPVVVAVLGSGAIARSHLTALSGMKNVRVKYVLGSDQHRAHGLAAIVPGSEAVTSLATVLDDSEVTAVDICGSTTDRTRLAVAAARAGKHSIIEKPAALSLTDFDLMTTAGERYGTSIMVGQTVRFQPVMAELHRAISAGSIGRPRLLHVSWYAGYSWAGGWRAWQLDRARSGGHALHNGPHSFDLGIWLTGRTPVRVFGRSFSSNSANTPVPESMLFTVRFDDDSLGTFEFSYSLTQRGDAIRRVMVAGETGTLTHSTESELGLDSRGPASADSPSVTGAMDAQLRHWIDTLNGAEAIVRLSEVRSALATAVAAQRSLDENRAVSLAEVDR